MSRIQYRQREAPRQAQARQRQAQAAASAAPTLMRSDHGPSSPSQPLNRLKKLKLQVVKTNETRFNQVITYTMKGWIKELLENWRVEGLTKMAIDNNKPVAQVEIQEDWSLSGTKVAYEFQVPAVVANIAMQVADGEFQTKREVLDALEDLYNRAFQAPAHTQTSTRPQTPRAAPQPQMDVIAALLGAAMAGGQSNDPPAPAPRTGGSGGGSLGGPNPYGLSPKTGNGVVPGWGPVDEIVTLPHGDGLLISPEGNVYRTGGNVAQDVVGVAQGVVGVTQGVVGVVPGLGDVVAVACPDVVGVVSGWGDVVAVDALGGFPFF